MSNLNLLFSHLKIGFLIIRVTIRTRESGVFIEAKNWLCEKTRLLLKLTDQRFHSAATNRRSNRRIRPDNNRGTTAVSFGGFVTAELTREIKNQSSMNGGFIRRP